MATKKYQYIYTRRKVIRKGKLDGKGWRWKFWPFQKETHPVHPTHDQQHPALFEEQLRRTGKDLLTDIATDWKAFDLKAKTDYCHAVKELEQAEEGLGRGNEKLQYAKEQYKSAVEEFEKLPVPLLSRKAELIFLFLLAIGEFAMNYNIFTILGQSKSETMVIALTFCVALPLAGYFFGSLLRKAGKTLIQQILLIVIPIIVVTALIYVALLRAELFADTSRKLKLSLSPFQLSIAFLVFNILIFILAGIVSYAAAHKHPGAWRKAKRKLNDTKQGLNHESKGHILAIKLYEEAEMKVVKKKLERKKMHELLLEKAKDVIQNVKWHISVYRTANQEVRKEALTPECFKVSPQDLNIPTHLQPESLTWDCKDFTNSIKKNTQE